jgi:hypothetical protein
MSHPASRRDDSLSRAIAARFVRWQPVFLATSYQRLCSAPCARSGRHRDGRDRREGRDLRAGLRRAQGRVADQVPAHGGADAGGRRLDWQDQEGRRVMMRR